MRKINMAHTQTKSDHYAKISEFRKAHGRGSTRAINIEDNTELSKDNVTKKTWRNDLPNVNKSSERKAIRKYGSFQRIKYAFNFFLILVWLTNVTESHTGFQELYSCLKRPCSHGVCVDHLNSSYSCFCEDGFTGYDCQTNWNECWSNPCRHGATCNDLIANFECHCPPGYTGDICESEINECLSNPCQNKGTCEDLLDKYLCTCPLGYSGLNCEVDVSVCNSSKELHSKCQNYGECVDGPGLQFYCNCTSGWRGKTCEEDINECLDAPCYNGGICVNLPGGFGCACQHGYTGRLCEDEVIQCKSNPCKNGAYCVMENETATCYCVPDFHGHLCQDRYNDCLPYAPRCQNGGTCIDGVDSFMCSCPPFVDGKLCHCVLTEDGERKCEHFPWWFEDKPYHPIKPTEVEPGFVTVSPDTPRVSDSATSVTEDYYDSSIIPSSYYFTDILSISASPTFPEVYETLSIIDEISSIIPSEGIADSSAKIDYSLLFTDLSVFPTIESSVLFEPTYVPTLESSVIFVQTRVPILESSQLLEPTRVLIIDSSRLLESTKVPIIETLESSILLEPTKIFTVESSLLLESTRVPAMESSSIKFEKTEVLPIDFTTILTFVEATPIIDVPPTAVSESFVGLFPSTMIEVTPFITTQPDQFTPLATSLYVELETTPTFTDITPALTSALDEKLLASSVFPTFQEPVTPDFLDYNLSTSDISLATETSTTKFEPDYEIPLFSTPGELHSKSTPKEEIDLGITYAGVDTTLKSEEDITTIESRELTPMPLPTEPQTESSLSSTFDTLFNVTLTPTISGVLPTDEDLTTPVFSGYMTSSMEMDLNFTYSETTSSIYKTWEPNDTTTVSSSIFPEMNATIDLSLSTNETLTQTVYEVTSQTTEIDKVTGIISTSEDIFYSLYTDVENLTTTESSINITMPSSTYTYNHTLSDLPFLDVSSESSTHFSIDTTFEGSTRDHISITTELLTDSEWKTTFPPDYPKETTFLEGIPTKEITTLEGIPTKETTTLEGIPTTETTTLEDIPVKEVSIPDMETASTEDMFISTYDVSTASSNISSPFSAPTSQFLESTSSLYAATTTPTELPYFFNETIVSESFLYTPKYDYTTVDPKSVKEVSTTLTTSLAIDVNFTRLVPTTEVAESSSWTTEDVITDADVIKTAPDYMNDTGTELNFSIIPFTTPTYLPITLEYEKNTTGYFISDRTSTLAPSIDVSEFTTSDDPSSQTLQPIEPPLLTEKPSVTGITEKEAPEGSSASATRPTIEMTMESITRPFALITTEEALLTETTFEKEVEPVTTPVGDFTLSPDVLTTTDFSTSLTTFIDSRCLNTSCYNEGICIVIAPGHEVCQCKFNYTGINCETYHYVRQPYFSGTSYLKLDVGVLSLKNEVKMYIQFSSKSPNGLLAYTEGNSESFFMLLLRSSVLEFFFSCGYQTVSVVHDDDKLSSNSKTEVLISLRINPHPLHPWGKGTCYASMQLNGSVPVISEQAAASAEVNLGYLYLGGLPEAYNSPHVIKAGYQRRLTGCVYLLEINDLEVDPWLAAIEGEGVEECGKALCPPNACLNGGSCIAGPAQWTCSCSEGYEGELCERPTCLNNPCFKGICLQSRQGDHENPYCLCPAELNGPQCKKQLDEEVGTRLLYTGFYYGYSSYSSHTIKFEHKMNFIIRLHFTTKNLNQFGLVFFLGQSPHSAKKDFFALSLVSGVLLLTWDLGSGVRRIATAPLDPSWHTHSVKVGRTSKLGWLEVDTQKNISSMSPGYLSSLDTDNTLYLGGHPTFNFTHLPIDFYKLQGFKGCIFDVRVAQSLDGPWMIPPIKTSLGVGQCEKDLCKDNACQNGAVCQPVGGGYRCICNPGSKGSHCDISSHYCGAQSNITCALGSTCLIGLKDRQPKCLCPYGKAGKLCNQNLAITDPRFSSDRSYISILGGKLLRGYTSVTLEFNPSSRNGILLLAVPTTPHGDFLSLYLTEGFLYFIFRLRNKLVKVASQQCTEMEKWQTVTILRKGHEGTLQFGNEMKISSTSPTKFVGNITQLERHKSMTDILDVQSELFLGGIPDQILLPNELTQLRNATSFKGCMRNVKIGYHKYNLDVLDEQIGVLRGQGIDDCDGTSCGSEVCHNGGLCSSVATNRSFSCTCSEDYIGQRCQTPTVCVDHKCQNGGICEPFLFQREIKEISTDTALQLTGATLANYYCLCPPIKIGVYCEEDGITRVAQFRLRSYAVVTQGPFLGHQDPRQDLISFNFTTLEPHSLLLWRGHIYGTENDFLGIGIYRARLKFVWHLGGEMVGEISPPAIICDGKWHSFSLERNDKVVSLFLDGVAFKKTLEGGYTQLNAPNTIYLGGFPDNNYLKYATSVHFEKNHFVGCLRDVLLHPGSSPVIFSSLREGRDVQPCKRPN